MKLRIRKCISGLLCFAMICMSFMQTAYAKPVENEPPSPEYDIAYRSIGEDDDGFTAQFTIKNNTEQAMTDWTFDFDYNEVIEQANTATVTVTDNGGNQQYKKHYQFKGMEEHKIIPAKSELVIQYRVNAKLNINDNPQNYDFKYSFEEPFIEISLDTSSLEYKEPGVYVMEQIPESLSGSVTTNYKLQDVKYRISVGNLEIDTGQLSEGEWSIPSPKFVSGLNNLEIIVEDTNGKIERKSYPIYSKNDNIQLDEEDNDGDKLPNWAEDMYGTDKNKADSDGDGLSDYEEVMVTRTNPLLKDSDSNSIPDGEEDFDNDGLTNLEEVAFGSDPYQADVDEDGLNDAKEKELGTDPKKEDTDNDNLSDAQELVLGTDPLNPDTNGNGILDGDEDYTIHLDVSEDEKDPVVEPSVDVTLTGFDAESIKIKRDNPESSVWMPKDVPGLIGSAYDFSAKDEIKEAEIAFKFDQKFLENENFNPQIYYIDTEKQEMYPLEDQKVDLENCVVKAKTTHFSKYALIDTYLWDKGWTEDIIAGEQDKLNARIDVTFVLDESGSMSWNDPQKVRVQVSKNFVNILRNEEKVHDKGAVIGFDDSARLLSPLTNDHDAIKKALDKISIKGGTSLSAGVSLALNQYPKPDITLPNPDDKYEKSMKIIILLTDGQGSYSDSHTQTAIEKGVKIYTVGLGSSYDQTLLQKIAEQTGAQSYHAENADDLIAEFEKLISESVDIVTDSDGDGLSDYHEERIRLFNGLTIQLDPNNPDCDGDGLKDGEEIIQTTDTKGRVFFRMKSHPNMADSDGDGIGDKEDSEPMNFKPLELALDQTAYFSSIGQTPEIVFEPKGYTGGYRIHLSGGSHAEIEVYKKGFFGGEKIVDTKTYNGDNDEFNFRLQLEMNTKYYVRIKNVPIGESYNVSVKENMDLLPKYSELNGGSWEPKIQVGSLNSPSGGFHINRVTYIDSKGCKDYWDELYNLDDGILKSLIKDFGIAGIGTALSEYLGLTATQGTIAGFALGVLYNEVSKARMASLRDDVIKKSNHYETGLALWSVTSNIYTYPTTQVLVEEAWRDDIMRGVKGYIGEFNKEVSPIWVY